MAFHGYPNIPDFISILLGFFRQPVIMPEFVPIYPTGNISKTFMTWIQRDSLSNDARGLERPE
jgi:hypothetical protein